MEQKTKNIQKMSIYFPLDLLARVREIAEFHRRSFSQEVLWILQEYLVEQGLFPHQTSDVEHEDDTDEEITRALSEQLGFDVSDKKQLANWWQKKIDEAKG